MGLVHWSLHFCCEGIRFQFSFSLLHHVFRLKKDGLSVFGCFTRTIEAKGDYVEATHNRSELVRLKGETLLDRGGELIDPLPLF